MHGYDQTKDQKWNTQMINSIVPPNNHLNQMNSILTGDNLTHLGDNKNGLQLINSTDCSSNGSILMNGSSNSNTSANSATLNPLINSNATILNSLTSFDHNDLRRPESVLSSALRPDLRPDTPSDPIGD